MILKEKNSDNSLQNRGEVLNKYEILSCMQEENPVKKLIVTPLLDESQIADGAIDIRLSTEFIFTRRTEFPSLDVSEAKEFEQNADRYQIKHRVNFHERVVLHPNELILGSTFEYICMPEDIFSYVLSRSSWGRMGLIVATATAINPGYKGCLTLEMLNLGRVPLVLYPGLSIAQLILHKASKGTYTGDYDCPTGPKPSPVYKKWDEIKFWVQQK